MEWFKGGTEERQGDFVLDGSVVEAMVINGKIE